MTVAILADAHISGPGGSAEALVEQLDELPRRGCTRLVLLGDLFHVWVGAKQFETPDIEQVLDALLRLRRRGVRVEYVEGNRDFFIADGVYASAFDRVSDEVAFEVAGRRYLAVHGDGLNAKDYAYRFWRWLSKSPPVRFAMLHLPRSLARRLVYSTERQLAKTNFKHKSEIPRAAISAYAERRLGEGYDVLVLGHFHEPAQWPLGEAGEVLLLDAWFNGRAIPLLGEAGE